MNHKYITCTGFGYTGSSVISDLMTEFNNVKSCGCGFEMSLAFDIGGVSDLQHYLVDDFERHKVSEGIFMFKRHISDISKEYCHFLGDEFETIMNSYINDLISLEWMGENYMQHYRYNKLIRYFYYSFLPRIQNKLRRILLKDDSYEHTAFYKKKLPMEISVEENVFYERTNKMFSSILDLIDKEFEYDYLCFDQLVPPYHAERYLKYFPNLKVIVVDRDPRDLFLLNELYWHEAWIPSHDISLFINWFKALRRESCITNEKGNPNIKYVKFEDAIYNYDTFLLGVIDFLGLEKTNHISPCKLFNPTISKKNTKLWEKNGSFKKEIASIEQNLPSYCYPY